MTTIETIDDEDLYKNQVSQGEQLASERENLSALLSSCALDDEILVSSTEDYINALHSYWFERGDDNCAGVLKNLPKIIKTEISVLFNNNDLFKETEEDINYRLDLHLKEETMNGSYDGCSPESRSAMFVVLDLIEEYKIN